MKAAGVTDAQIGAMKARGAVPQGYQVPHKLPLDDGGTNASPNLVLIENEPFHKVITNSQASMTEGMKPGETRQLDFPIPEGSIYP